MHLKKNYFIKRVLVIVIAIMTTLYFAGCSGLEDKVAVNSDKRVGISDDVQTDQVKKGDISIAVQGAGLITPAKAVELYYKNLSGPLKKVNVMLGDQIKAGQTVLEIDVKQITDDVNENHLLLKIMELKNEQNDLNMEMNKLSVEQAVEQKNVAQAIYAKEPTISNKNSLKKIKAQYANAINNLKISAINKEMGNIQVNQANMIIEKTKAKLQQGALISPVAGKVVFMENLYEKQQIDSGRVLLRVAGTSDMVFQMASSLTKNVQGKYEAYLTINNKKYPVQLYIPKPGDLLDKSDNEQKVMNRIYLAFKGEVPKIDMDQSVQANLYIGKKGVLLIPKNDVTQVAGKSVVDILKDGTAKTVEVQTGMANDKMIEILDGVEEGAKVLAR